MRARPVPAVVMTVALLAGCAPDTSDRSGRLVTAATSPAPATAAATTPTPAPAGTEGPDESPTTTAETGNTTTNREITVYYTAVERFHDGGPERVTGCPRLDCANGDDDLGAYPEDFVKAVQDEGTGLTREGTYLNWSYDTGYWLDSQPRTSDGSALTPFVSSAADPDVLPQGTAFTITDCGTRDDGSEPDTEVCDRLRGANWRISDEFTPGLGGPKHLDAYIGPETGPGFTDSAWYVTLTNAVIRAG
jgi:hypothetical protein